jgi:hypothetical protein
VIASGLFQHESKMYVLHFRYSGVYTAVYSFQFFRNRLHYFNFSHNMCFSMFFIIKKHDTCDAPIKAKEELVFHVGFRQFVAR